MQGQPVSVRVWILYAQQDFHPGPGISSYSSSQEPETVAFPMLFYSLKLLFSHDSHWEQNYCSNSTQAALQRINRDHYF